MNLLCANGKCKECFSCLAKEQEDRKTKVKNALTKFYARVQNGEFRTPEKILLDFKNRELDRRRRENDADT